MTMPLRPTTGLDPFSNPLDALLADVAIRIQLSRSNYEKAAQRYRAINNWIERPNSPLENRVELFYPQGSMATESTIASRLRTDEFDIDIAAQIAYSLDVDPQTALDTLCTAIRGEPGSRYYDMTKLRTRCVTVSYRDNMHLDVTPMLRRPGTPDRESWIFHHRPEVPHEPGYPCIANPYGFAQWFQAKTPADHDFAVAYESRALHYEQIEMATAESDPVPSQKSPSRKSIAVIALQLLKRWRNVQYDTRPGRRPPSIMISKLVADHANTTPSLSAELLHQAQSMLAEFERWHGTGRLIRVANPVCLHDVLTDRWPESLLDQEVFLADLRALVKKAEHLVSECGLDEMKEILAKLFGEKPTEKVFREFNRRQGDAIRDGRSRHLPHTGGLVVPTVLSGGASQVPPEDRPTPRHTFYGSERIQ